MKKENNVFDPVLTRIRDLFSKESKEYPKSFLQCPRRAYDYLKLPRLLMSKKGLTLEVKKEQDLSRKQVTCTEASYCSLISDVPSS